MRGQYSIFQSLLDSPGSPQSPLKGGSPERKGRNEVLLRKQNDLLIHRYYYHIKICNQQYLRTLHILEHEELFIAERTIIDIINKHSDKLRELHKSKPSKAYFRKKYPMWVW